MCETERGYDASAKQCLQGEMSNKRKRARTGQAKECGQALDGMAQLIGNKDQVSWRIKVRIVIAWISGL